MSLVGNDVVDLDDVAAAASHLRPRFVARVCHARERALLAGAADGKALLWSLFAAKEAAFKVVSKLGPAPVFAHRRFEVAPDLRAVRYEGLELALRVEVQGRYVHAVAWLGEGPWESGVERVPPGADAGLVARRALLSRLGGDGLAVERPPRPGSWDGYGPPRVTRRGEPLPVDVSLSHDGRFAAYCFCSVKVPGSEGRLVPCGVSRYFSSVPVMQ